jgi:membrane protein required for colicin V production
MNFLDLIIAVLLGWGLIRGWFRGIIKELISIIAVFGGFYAGYTYYPMVLPYLDPWLPRSPEFSWNPYKNVMCFFILFFAIFLTVSVLGIVLKYFAKIGHLGWFDKILGAGFGIVKSSLIASIIVLGVTMFLPRGMAHVVETSALSPHVVGLSKKLAAMVPDELYMEFEEKMEYVKGKWEEAASENE